MDFSLLSMLAYSIINHPLWGCGNDSYTKKITFLVYNVVVQATNIIKKGDFMATKTNSLSHARCICKYHIVFTPKYRRKAIYNQYREDLGEILRTLCRYRGVEIIEGHLMIDHVHMLVMIPPKESVSSFMGYLKGKSALMMFDRHANLKYLYGNRHFWAEGYYVSTVGLNDETVAKYIREQEAHDIAMDKLSVKEYRDPFEEKRITKEKKKEKKKGK